MFNLSGEQKKELSNWQKPGGTLGMIVAGLGLGGGLLLLSTILPFLISLTTNILTLSILCIGLFLLFYLVTNKQFINIISTTYFMLMRKITGLVIEIDPIAIVEHKLLDMKAKVNEIENNMGQLRGLNIQNERTLMNKKAELEKQIGYVKEYKERGLHSDAQVAERQIVRLDGAIQRQHKRLMDSTKWYEILKNLKASAELTIKDTEYEIADRKEEYESIKAQHKAFSSIMSIIKGSPDEMDNFTRAMDYMAYDITKRLGEMTNIIDETGGIISQIGIDNAVTSKKAEELLKKYDQNGIDAIFSTTKKELNDGVSLKLNQKLISSLGKEKELNNNKYKNFFKENE